MSAPTFQQGPIRGPVFGSSQPRREDQRFVTGQGRYTDDLCLPGQAWAAFVRSPHAHARIRAIDVADACAAPGVIGVITGADYAAEGLGALPSAWDTRSKDGSPARIGTRVALSADVVRYVGEPVAVVIAERRDLARDAAERVWVDYDPLPAAATLTAARAPDAPALHAVAPDNVAFEWETGDADATDAAFRSAAHHVVLDLVNSRLVPNAMEPRAANAVYDPGTGQFTLHLTTQNPHGKRGLLSGVIGLAADNEIRVVSGDVGGGFGSKAMLYPEEIVCMVAARRFGRPVKWTAERGEAFLGDAHGRDHESRVELALDADYRFTGLRIRTRANLGAYASTFGTLVPTVMYALITPGQYVIPAAYVEVAGIYTNTAPVDAYRGAGRPEACYAIERVVEHAARTLGLDPAALRRRNFVRSFPHRSALGLVYDTGDFVGLLDRALELIDYPGFPARRAHSAARGLLRGIGFSAYIEIAGFGPSRLLGQLGAPGGVWESAEIRVNASGTVEVITGCHSHGQSHETTYAQLVCDRLGVPFEAVRIHHGDTWRGPAGSGTSGSRSSVGLSAIDGACDKIIAKARTIAANLLNETAERLTFAEGAFSAPGGGRVTFGEVAAAAYAAQRFPTDMIEPGLHAVSFFDPQNFTYPGGCYICEVEIDPETGVTRIVDFVAADDFGRIANPMIVHGQVQGGITQGIGQALLERCVYDPESAQLLSGSFMDYAVPRADDVPRFRITLQETPCPGNPLGMKGCGEAGAIGAPPAVINAITDALGVIDIEMPATPERVWRIANGRHAG
jgi:carbon-monoxide dehydrogenase large subunit